MYMTVTCMHLFSAEPQGTITQAPEAATINEGETAEFNCEAVGNVAWSINDVQVKTKEKQELLKMAGIDVPLSTPSKSTVTIQGYASLNETTVQCLAVNPDDQDDVLSSSETVTLIVKGIVHILYCVLYHCNSIHLLVMFFKESTGNPEGTGRSGGNFYPPEEGPGGFYPPEGGPGGYYPPEGGPGGFYPPEGGPGGFYPPEGGPGGFYPPEGGWGFPPG